MCNTRAPAAQPHAPVTQAPAPPSYDPYALSCVTPAPLPHSPMPLSRVTRRPAGRDARPRHAEPRGSIIRPLCPVMCDTRSSCRAKPDGTAISKPPCTAPHRYRALFLHGTRALCRVTPAPLPHSPMPLSCVTRSPVAQSPMSLPRRPTIPSRKTRPSARRLAGRAKMCYDTVTIV